MPKTKKTCPATVQTADDRELTCSLPEGHDGPVHQDDNGEQWGDLSLPAAHHVEQ